MEENKNTYILIPGGSQKYEEDIIEDKEGYNYVYFKTTNNSVVWRCSHYDKYGNCGATVIQYNRAFVPGICVHNHPTPKKHYESNKKNKIKYEQDNNSGQYELIKSGTNQGGDMLVSEDGYCFTIKRVASNSITWACNSRKRNVACAAVIKQLGSDNYNKGPVEHNHDPDVTLAVKAKFVLMLKRKVWDSSYNNFSASKVVQETLLELPEFQRKHITCIELMKRRFNRFRKDQIAMENLALNAETQPSKINVEDSEITCSHNRKVSIEPGESRVKIKNDSPNLCPNGPLECQIISRGGKKGTDLLVTAQGYCYHKVYIPSYKNNNESTLWKCYVRDQKKQRKGVNRGNTFICGAKVWQWGDKFISGAGGHKHSPDPKVPATALFMSKLKMQLLDGAYNEKNANVHIARALDAVDPKTRSLLPNREEIKVLLRKFKTDQKRLSSTNNLEQEDLFTEITKKRKRSMDEIGSKLTREENKLTIFMSEGTENIELCDDSLNKYKPEKAYKSLNIKQFWKDSCYQIFENTGMNPSDLLISTDSYVFVKSAKSEMEWKCIVPSCNQVVVQCGTAFKPDSLSKHEHSSCRASVFKVIFMKMLKEKCEDPSLSDLTNDEILNLLCLFKVPEALYSLFPHEYVLKLIVKKFRKNTSFKKAQRIKSEPSTSHMPDDLEIEDFDNDGHNVPLEFMQQVSMKHKTENIIKPIQEQNTLDLADAALNIFTDTMDLPETIAHISSEEVEYEVLQTNRGTPLLASSRGYLFHMKHSSRQFIRWTCTVKNNSTCSAIVRQYSSHFDEGSCAHNHPSSILTVIKTKVYNIIKECLCEDNAMPIDHIIYKIFRRIAPLYHRFIPSVQLLKRSIYKFRNMAGFVESADMERVKTEVDFSDNEYFDEDLEDLNSEISDSSDPEEKVSTTYEVLKSVRGQDILVSNTGYMYNRLQTSGNMKKWKCLITSSGSSSECPAILRQYNNVYEEGEHWHNHPPSKKLVTKKKFSYKIAQYMNSFPTLNRAVIMQKVMKCFTIADHKYFPSSEDIRKLFEKHKEQKRVNHSTNNLIGNYESNQQEEDLMDEPEPLEETYDILKTRAGKPLLISNKGYIYHKKSEGIAFIKWVCGATKKLGEPRCPVLLRQYDDLFDSNQEVPHTHAPSLKTVVKAQILFKLRENMKLLNVLSKEELLNYIYDQFPHHHRKYFPPEINLKRTLSRYLVEDKAEEVNEELQCKFKQLENLASENTNSINHEIIKNSEGDGELMCSSDGFLYCVIQELQNLDKIWACILHYSTSDCPAIVFQSGNNFTVTVQHNHSSDMAKLSYVKKCICGKNSEEISTKDLVDSNEIDQCKKKKRVVCSSKKIKLESNYYFETDYENDDFTITEDFNKSFSLTDIQVPSESKYEINNTDNFTEYTIDDVEVTYSTLNYESEGIIVEDLEIASEDYLSDVSDSCMLKDEPA